jgi:hypothetical protein
MKDLEIKLLTFGRFGDEAGGVHKNLLKNRMNTSRSMQEQPVTDFDHLVPS